MDSRDAQYLFKETRLNLETSSSASVVNIRVPASTANGRSHRKLAIETTFEDENSFRLKYLATASSVYHRKWHDSPRSFLWRVLEDGKVLSIRAVDICKSDKTPDTPLILNLKFDATIQPGCVAFADPKEHDALAVHVLDSTNQIYTFTFRPDSFRKKSAVDAGLTGIAKVQAPSGLGFKHAHRMIAVSSDLLLITSHDGGIIRLDKPTGHDHTKPQWTQRFFNVQGWAQNLRSLLPFQGKHTVPYGKVNMEYSAATSIQVTSFGLDDCLFAVTVCLDHRMRIWNLDDGQIILTRDILNADRSPQEIGKWSIDPSQSNLLQITGNNRGHRICSTYSPVGPGEFKFWKIAAKDAHTVVIDDMFPKEALHPVTPSSDVWTLTDFVLASPDEDSINLWTLWKNNLTYRVQRLELERPSITHNWRHGWDAVFSETGLLTAENSGPCDPTDVTEKWLAMILQPGKFTKATLQTALSIYERGLGAAKDGNQNRGLAESICSVLGSTASLDRGSTGAMDYEQFRSSSEAQWRRFYRLLVELDRQRGEAIGLAMSPNDDMVWVVCTDMISAIRECSSLERLYHSLDAPADDQGHMAAIVGSALTLVDGFSDHFVQLSNAALRPELFEESEKSDLQRLEAFENKAGFWRGITEEDCAQVNEALGTNFDKVDDNLYTDVLDLIAAPSSSKNQSPRYPLTDFGRKLVLQGAQDNIDLRWKVCFAQLILLAHMEFDFDTDEDQLHNRVDVGTVFKQLVDALRRLELLKWLSSTEVAMPQSIAERRGSVVSKKGSEEPQVVTALDLNVSHLLGFSDSRSENLSANITDLVSNLCAPDSDIEILPPLVQCRLVKDDRADLALGLAPFADQSAFSTYVQGRVFLALKDFSSAALCFRDASEGMSASTVRLERHSSGLLDDTEWNLLNSGLAKYYSHVVALYEKQRAYSYVIEFARLALQHFGDKRDASLTKVDMLSRLFNAAVATSQFHLAHSSLQSFKDDALRHSSLRKLVDRMCESCHNHELVGLSFPGMQQDVDDILTQRCKSTMDVVQGSPYHQLLYSWRIKHDNYRGAATVLFDRIQKLRLVGEGDKIAGDDTFDTPVTKQYLLLINALTCVEPKQAWIYDESGFDAPDGIAKRKLVTLADVRKQYQDELDRIAAIQNNQFGFEADDVMEIA